MNIKYLYHVVLSFSLLIFISCGTNDSYKYPVYNNKQVTINLDDLQKVYDTNIIILDGDTIKLHINNEDTKIRLIGIDAFETTKSNKAYKQAYQNQLDLDEVIRKGKETKEFLKELLKNKTEFFLEYDEDKKDDYGRILAYVWTSSTQMINMQIICSGYADILTISPNDKYANQFETCLEFAKQKNLGIWN